MYMCDSSETFLELIGLCYHFHPFEGQENIIFQTPIIDTFHGETNFVVKRVFWCFLLNGLFRVSLLHVKSSHHRKITKDKNWLGTVLILLYNGV